MAPKRSRSLANPAVNETVYFEVIRNWMRKESIQARLGPHLVAEGGTIQPSMMIQAAGLLQGFIEAGCKNGVVFPSRMETAVKR
jgi:hypothetical protein